MSDIVERLRKDGYTLDGDTPDPLLEEAACEIERLREAWVDGKMREDRDTLVTRLADCEADRLEQARCNGMGSEREARLMARLAETEALLREALPAVHSYARKHCRAVVAAARRNDVANVAKHADIEKKAWGLADKIRAFLALDSAP